MTDLISRLSKCYASAIHDVLREKGYGNCVLPPEIQALERGQKLFGEIYTVSGHIDKTLSRHESLLLWSQVLSKVPNDKVIVCQPNTHSIALMGELSARALMVKGTKGYLMDGHCRDVEEIIQNFLYFRYACSGSIPCNIAFRISLSVAIISSVLFIALSIGCILFLSKEFLYDLSVYFLTPSNELKQFYKEYLFVRMIGLPAGLLNIVFLGWFFGMQKTKSVMAQLVSINLVNVILSVYLAVYLDLGIYGVALGSVLAQFTGLILSSLIFLIYFKNSNFSNFKLIRLFDFNSFKKLFSISKDLFLRTMLLVAVQAYLIKKAGLIGVDELATIEILLVIFGLSSYS